MAKKKYMYSSGIAFGEGFDLRRLRKYAAKGWVVKRYKNLGYELEQSEPEDVIFNIDIRRLDQDEKEEYFDIFRVGGWQHVCSIDDIHLFKAAPGTRVIYTDIHSKREKLKRLKDSLVPISIFSVLLSACSYLGLVLTTGTTKQVFDLIFNLSLIFLIPVIMMMVAYYYRSIRLNKIRKI